MTTEIQIKQGKLIRTLYDHGGSRIWVEAGDKGRDLQADTYDQPMSDIVFEAIKKHFGVGDESQLTQLQTENERLRKWIDNFAHDEALNIYGNGLTCPVCGGVEKHKDDCQIIRKMNYDPRKETH